MSIVQKEEELALNGHGPRSKLDDGELWRTIGLELLSRDYDTLTATLKSVLPPPEDGEGEEDPFEKLKSAISSERVNASEPDEEAELYETIKSELLKERARHGRAISKEVSHLYHKIGNALFKKQLGQDEGTSPDAVKGAILQVLLKDNFVETFDNAIDIICKLPDERFETLATAAREAQEMANEAEKQKSGSKSRVDVQPSSVLIEVAECIDAARMCSDVSNLKRLKRLCSDILNLKAEDILSEGFRVVSESPERTSILAAYLYARHLKMWETTSDWPGIRRVIVATTKALNDDEFLKALNPDVSVLVRGFRGLIEAVNPAMAVESGLNCSCPETMRRASDRVIELASSTLCQIGKLSDTDRDIALSNVALIRARKVLRQDPIRSDTAPYGPCRDFVLRRTAN